MKNHEHNLNVKKVERPSKTQVRLQLEYSPDTLRQELERTSRQYLQAAKLPGFRPGKAPLAMVKAKYKDQIQKDVISHLVEAGISEAVEKTNLVPVSQPQIKVTQLPDEAEKPLLFEAEFEVSPEIELRNYKGVPVKKGSDEATEEEVQKTLENIRERLATLEPSDAKTGEKGLFGVVEIGYQVKGADKKEEPKSFTVELGAEKLIPELEAAFLSLNVGESRQVEGKFPDDFSDKELAGKEATFDCKLLEVKKKVLPELDDSLAAQLKEGHTLEALKNEIRENIRQSKSEENRRTQRREIMDYLIANHAFDVPASLVDQQARSLVQWMFEDMKRRGVQQFPQLGDKDIEELKRRAEHMVRSSLLLKEIAQKEKIELDESRVQAKVEGLASQLKQDPAQTIQLLEQRGMLDKIRDEVLTDQVFEFLVENARVVEATPKR